MKSKQIVRYVFMALSAAVMVLIFFFSSQNGEQSGELSGWVSEAVETVFNAIHMPSAAEFVMEYIRKFAHVFIYACLGVCVSVCAFTYPVKYKWLWIAIPLAICFVYACSDEFHQTFVVGRDGKFLDVLVDAIGFCVTIAVSNLIWFLILRHRTKKSSGAE